MDAGGWSCAKCDGAADVALHSRHCPLRGQEEAVGVVDWSAIPILERRPGAGDDDASPRPQD
jgi:hypothetical protein